MACVLYIEYGVTVVSSESFKLNSFKITFVIIGSQVTMQDLLFDVS